MKILVIEDNSDEYNNFYVGDSLHELKETSVIGCNSIPNGLIVSVWDKGKIIFLETIGPDHVDVYDEQKVLNTIEYILRKEGYEDLL